MRLALSGHRNTIYTLFVGGITLCKGILFALAGIKNSKFVQSGTPYVDHNTFPWTGCPESFTDVADSGP